MFNRSNFYVFKGFMLKLIVRRNKNLRKTQFFSLKNSSFQLPDRPDLS